MKTDETQGTWWTEWEKYREESDRKWEEFLIESRKREEKFGLLSDKVGGLENNIGYHVEQYFQDSLNDTLEFGGESYDKLIPNLKPLGKKGGAEFDIVLINGKSAAIIETKHRIHPSHIQEMVEKKVAQFRHFFPEYGKLKVYLGVAGFSFAENAPELAKEYGVGIIKPVGKSVEIEADNLKAY